MMIDQDDTTVDRGGGRPIRLGSRLASALTSAGLSVMGCLLMIVILLVLPVLFLKGAIWAAEHVLPPLILVGWVALAFDILLLLPLALVKVLRPWCAGFILLSSLLFGLISWFLGLILTYTLWGIGAVIVGLFLLGVGVVPFALLATLFKGMWSQFFTVAVLVILTFGSRFVAVALGPEE